VGIVRKEWILIALLIISIDISLADNLGIGDKICYNSGYCYTIATNSVYFTDLVDNGVTATFTGLQNTTVVNITDDELVSSGSSTLILPSPPHNVSIWFTSTAPYISLTFYYSTVSFGTLEHNTTDNPATSQLTGIYNATIDAIAKYKFSCSATDFSDGSHEFDVSNVKVDMNTTSTDLSLSSAKNISTSPVLIDTDISSSVTTNFHGFYLTIPPFQYGGSYTSNMTMTYGLV
jgi:hypothetical protein